MLIGVYDRLLPSFWYINKYLEKELKNIIRTSCDVYWNDLMTLHIRTDIHYNKTSYILHMGKYSTIYFGA